MIPESITSRITALDGCRQHYSGSAPRLRASAGEA